jgi:hypothetical protein
VLIYCCSGADLSLLAAASVERASAEPRQLSHDVHRSVRGAKPASQHEVKSLRSRSSVHDIRVAPLRVMPGNRHPAIDFRTKTVRVLDDDSTSSFGRKGSPLTAVSCNIGLSTYRSELFGRSVVLGGGLTFARAAISSRVMSSSRGGASDGAEVDTAEEEDADVAADICVCCCL